MPALRVLMISLAVCLVCSNPPLVAQIPPVDFSTQGSSMKLRWNNVGAFGHIACPPFNAGNPGMCPAESIGMEYPAGSGREHLWAGALWVGGKPDATTRLVSVTYEGWSGPYYEFFPGGTAADTIWRVAQWAPKPPGWDAYWGEDLPYRPFADDNQYCRYTDTSVAVAGHIPLALTVVHSSYTWNDPSADGIHVVEVRISNAGDNVIDSAYIGVYFEPDFGGSIYTRRTCCSFIPPAQLVICHQHMVDSLPTPCGIALLYSPLPPDSMGWTWQLFAPQNTPPDDYGKYGMLSSRTIAPDPYPCLIGPCVVLAFGPFTLQPAVSGDTEALRVALAYLSAPDIGGISQRAETARQLYQQGTGVRPPQADLPVSPALMQNYPNPFNAETRIEYALDGRSAGERVTLTVYDLLGREVAVLVDGTVGPGGHMATFRAGDCSGGVYYYRLRAGGCVETKAMVLLK